MGLMSQMQQGNNFLNLSGEAANIAKQITDNNMTCTLPDGRQVTLFELADMVKGQTPQQAFASMGLDYSRYV